MTLLPNYTCAVQLTPMGAGLGPNIQDRTFPDTAVSFSQKEG